MIASRHAAGIMKMIVKSFILLLLLLLLRLVLAHEPLHGRLVDVRITPEVIAVYEVFHLMLYLSLM